MSSLLPTAIVLGLPLLVFIWSRVESIESEHSRFAAALQDEQTGTFGAAAIPVCLVPELEATLAHGEPLALAQLSYHGSDIDEAVRRVTRIARVHEAVYRTDARRIVMLLHGVERTGAHLAVARLGGAMTNADPMVVDGGVALAPEDGESLDELLQYVESHRQPVQDIADGIPFTTHTENTRPPSLWRAPTLAAIALLTGHLLFPHVPTPHNALGFTLSFVLLLALASVLIPLTRWATPWVQMPREAWAVSIALALLALGTTAWPPTERIGDIAMLPLVFLLGALATVVVPRLEVLVAIMIWGGISDLWSFYSHSGPTRLLLENTGYAGRLTFIDVPEVGSYAHLTSIGFVDLLAIAAIFVCCERFGIPLRRLIVCSVVVLPLVGMTARMADILSLPFIPVLSVIVVAATWPYLQYPTFRAQAERARHR